MNTIITRIGFLSILMSAILISNSCNEKEVAKTSILVLQKQPQTTGLQPQAVEGAQLKLFVDKPSNFQEVIITTNASGYASFEYEFPVVLDVEVQYDGRLFTGYGVRLELGETFHQRIILPE